MANTPLPDKSEASVTRGVWFVFPIAGATIRAWGGAGGTERIYFDSDLVSEKRSVRRGSTHSFVRGDDTYEVRFQTHSYLRAHVECALSKNDKHLANKSVQYDGAGTSPKRILLSALAGGVASGIVFVLKWPLWCLFPMLAIILYIQAVTRRKGKGYVITE
jgi:hypothetical protein